MQVEVVEAPEKSKFGKRYSKTCVVCAVVFSGQLRQRFCTKVCAVQWSGKTSPFKGISPGTVGAIQELRVALDLMGRGYDVFRPLSPACSCDLLATKDNKLFKIEVRTAYKRGDGHIQYPPKNIRAPYLALALPNEIVYRPRFDE